MFKNEYKQLQSILNALFYQGYKGIGRFNTIRSMVKHVLILLLDRSR